ncbi:hypothetical protein QP157_12825 [Sphingomonas sp. LR61]
MPNTPAADPYTPHSGDRRWSAEHYDLRLDYRVATNRLDGTATITARAHEPLDRIVIDLHGLSVERADVDGTRAKKVSKAVHKVTVTPASPIAADTTFTVHLRYRGNPRPVRSAWGQVGWEELTDGVIVAAQPTGHPRGSRATTDRTTRRPTGSRSPPRLRTTSWRTVNCSARNATASAPAGPTPPPSRWRRTWRRCRSGGTARRGSAAPSSP